MGRWSQRTRCGGGKSLNFMTLAIKSGSEEVVVTFLLPITAAWFDPTSFSVSPADLPAEVITQESDNQLRLDFQDTITSNTSLVFSGTIPQLLSPQTVPLI